MKRQRIRAPHAYDDYREVRSDDDADTIETTIPLQTQRIRKENVLEAQIQEGDTLQAIALRCNCTISDIKRLNKIEKEVEIHARKTIKVPANAYSILLNTSDDLPTVHTSGQSSPKSVNHHGSISAHHNPLLAGNGLDEKLLVASVTMATPNSASSGNSINDIILNSAMALKEHGVELDDALDGDDESPHRALLTDGGSHSIPHAIRGAPKTDLTCSGSDCDISWICLLVFILALCFAIPLIYIFYIAEHPDKFHH